MRIALCFGFLLAAVGCSDTHLSSRELDAAAPGEDASCSQDRPRIYPDAGDCDDAEPVRGQLNLEANGLYQITCDPQPLEAAGCKGVPNDSWSRCALRRCAPTQSYPVGCIVVTPTSAPHLHGQGQGFECMMMDGKPQWVGWG